MDYLFLAGSLVLLVAGGELLVRGASRTAERLGMSPLLIGLTLVGFGTSTPELVTSVQASLAGSPGIAVGNIVGSNIANILLILGVAAVITPIAVRQQALMRDGMVVLATAAVFCAIGFALPLDRTVGAVFIAGLGAYLYYVYRQETAGAPGGHTAAYEKFDAHRKLQGSAEDNLPPAPQAAVLAINEASLLVPLLLAIGGLIIVIAGGKLLVDCATGVARSFGISETVIGLTVVAIGTSLPELVTSVIAAVRRQGDMALGNILGIGGVTALIAPTVIPAQIVRFDNLIMLAVSAALLVIARTGYRIGRIEGMALMAGYGAYVWVVWPH